MNWVGWIIIFVGVFLYLSKLHKIITRIQDDIHDLKAHTGLLEKEKFMRDLAINDPDSYYSLITDQNRNKDE